MRNSTLVRLYFSISLPPTATNTHACEYADTSSQEHAKGPSTRRGDTFNVDLDDAQQSQSSDCIAIDSQAQGKDIESHTGHPYKAQQEMRSLTLHDFQILTFRLFQTRKTSPNLARQVCNNNRCKETLATTSLDRESSLKRSPARVSSHILKCITHPKRL